MVVFATCRLSSAYLAQYGVDDRLCDVVANFTPDRVEKLINLTKVRRRVRMCVCRALTFALPLSNPIVIPAHLLTTTTMMRIFCVGR